MGQSQSTAKHPANRNLCQSTLNRHLHPTRYLHKSFYLLRLTVLVNDEETQVRVNDSIPELYSDALNHSILLCDIARGMNEILNEHGVTLQGAHYDCTCPIFILGLSPLLSKREADDLLAQICSLQQRVCSMLLALVPHTSLQPVPLELAVDLRIYLCFARKSQRKVCAVNVGVKRNLTKSHIEAQCEPENCSTAVNSQFNYFKRGVVDAFCDIQYESSDTTLECNNATLCEPNLIKVLPVLQKAADAWSTIGLLLGVPPYHIRVLEQQYPSSPFDCVSGMLVWLFDNTKVTWKLVVTALWYGDKKQLARMLCEKNGIELLLNELEEEEASMNVREREEERVEQTERHLEEIKVSSHTTQNDVKKLCDEFPKLLDHCEELRKEKQNIQEKLSSEQAQCAELKEARRNLESALEQKDVKIFDLENKIAEVTIKIDQKEMVIENISSQLEDTQVKYKQCHQKLDTLGKELAKKRLELKEKTQVVKALENILVQGCSAEINNKAEQQTRSEGQSIQKAREQSQSAYITEIEYQLKSEELKVNENERREKQLTSAITKQRDDIAALERKISNEENFLKKIMHLAQSEDDKNAEKIAEKELEIAGLEMDIIRARERCVTFELDLSRVRQDKGHRRRNIERKKNLLPDLSRTSVAGESYGQLFVSTSHLGGKPLEMTVFLKDRDGKPCSGEHVVTAQCGNGEITTGRKESSSSIPGCYVVPCTLSEENEDGSWPVSVFINGKQGISYNIVSFTNPDSACPICLTEPTNTFFEPCHHQTCWECAQKLDYCAVCRMHVTQKIRAIQHPDVQ